MTDSKRPGGLLSQYNLLGAIIDAPWVTRLDIKVARHVIDRYYPKHGNGRASLRYLERATGALRPSIIASLRRLADNGAITMLRQGQGTRPTEYALNFDFTSSGIVDDTSGGIVGDTSSTDFPSGIVDDTSGGIVGDTSSADFPSGIVDDTSGGIVGDTSSASSGIVDDTESYLLNPAYKAEIQIDRNDCGLATPGAAGLAAASPSTPQEGEPTFEALWRGYDYAKGKKEARAAWNALPPDTNLAAVIEAAKAWQESWAAQGKPDAPRFTLARWLRDERFDEDAPRGFLKVERAKSKPASKSKPAKVATRTTARVTAADVVETGDVTELRITATDADGCTHERFIQIQHPDEDTQSAGQRQLAALGHAAGLEQISDSAELLGRTIIITSDGYTAPTTRPDDEPPVPVEPVPEVRPQPEPCDTTRREPTEWEQRKAEQWKREAGRREWDAAHPELFEDEPAPLPPQPDDWPDWMEDAA